MSDPDIVEILLENCTKDCVKVRSIDLAPCYICEAADEIERLRRDRDRWRNVADELVRAADIQVHLSSVPQRYPWYSQHLKDAIALYKEAQK